MEVVPNLEMLLSAGIVLGGGGGGFGELLGIDHAVDDNQRFLRVPYFPRDGSPLTLLRCVKGFKPICFANTSWLHRCQEDFPERP